MPSLRRTPGRGARGPERPDGKRDRRPSAVDAPSFPAAPVGLRGRATELATLARAIDPARPRRLALVGQGGSGKSLLACALGHRVAPAFAGRVHWFRVGAWDPRTLAEMLAIRFGTTRERRALFAGLRRYLSMAGPTFVVLDNHEDDRATAALLDELRGAPVTWVVTARRCLLSGVSIFPVTAPLVQSGRSAFPRVARLTEMLRFNPLALDIANALTSSKAVGVRELASWLRERGVDRVRAVDHEDDLPEVSLLVDWAFQRLERPARAILLVLARLSGDHAGADSLFALARARAGGDEAIDALRRWHLVQEPFAGRFALHAVVKHALRDRARVDPARIAEHFIRLLERRPDRFDLEQTHLFGAMDYAHAQSDLSMVLRIDRLLRALGS